MQRASVFTLLTVLKRSHLRCTQLLRCGGAKSLPFETAIKICSPHEIFCHVSFHLVSPWVWIISTFLAQGWHQILERELLKLKYKDGELWVVPQNWRRCSHSGIQMMLHSSWVARTSTPKSRSSSLSNHNRKHFFPPVFHVFYNQSASTADKEAGEMTSEKWLWWKMLPLYSWLTLARI